MIIICASDQREADDARTRRDRRAEAPTASSAARALRSDAPPDDDRRRQRGQVSQTTVSLALNHADGARLSPHTRERVFRAAAGSDTGWTAAAERRLLFARR